MENSEIKYKTSTDYTKLYQFLKEGNLIIGFIAIETDGKISADYSKLISMRYNPKFKAFDVSFTFFESDFDQKGFEQLCSKFNIRFIPIV